MHLLLVFEVGVVVDKNSYQSSRNNTTKPICMLLDHKKVEMDLYFFLKPTLLMHKHLSSLMSNF